VSKRRVRIVTRQLRESLNRPPTTPALLRELEALHARVDRLERFLKATDHEDVNTGEFLQFKAFR
jgi:hypothetical protein